MTIGGKLMGFVVACSLTTLLVAGVSLATLQSFEGALAGVEGASVRALNAANFNRLATHVTMESRGIYASADKAEAGKYAAGVRKGLAAMDDLLNAWAPLVTEAERPLFEAMSRDAAAFRKLRTELAAAGTQIGPGVQILTADHPRDPVERRAGLEFGRPIRVGANVWIGGAALILPGVTVGDDAIIGAGAVVTRDVAAGATVVGNPARPIAGA